ncbi:thiamine phosphate synthase [Laceyella tengchongensis]|uniref:thiamine phosphate synthase n=1 Tax=Laceyella tengchongensis TaxID=574699 RepID=UPI00254862C8|nr:thiamine phosphate synthase [Laceyella tengchongensis]
MKLELHVISSSKQTVQELARCWLRLVPEVDWFHLRYKQLSDDELMQRAKALLSAGIPAKSLIVNSSVTVAEALGLGGIHLPERMPFPPAMSPAIRVGKSVHSLAAAERAADEGADYLMVGHIFPSASKPGLPPLGSGQLRVWVEQVKIPMIAVGGIGTGNVAEIKRAGCHGIAVISAVVDHEQPERVARELRRRWENADC